MSLIPYSTEKQMTVLIMNADGSPATGKSVDCSIRRSSDGKWWEGTGSTWEVAKQDNAMSEIGNGLYYYDFSATGVGSSDDTIVVYYEESTIPCYGTDEFQVTELFDEVSDVNSLLEAVRGEAVTDGSNTTLTFETDLAETSDDFYNNLQIKFETGPNIGQARRISDYNGTTKFVTVDDSFDTIPVTTDEFVIISDYTSAGSSLTPSAIAIAVWDELLAGHITPLTFGVLMKDIKTVVDAVKVDTTSISNRLPATLISGLIRAHTQDKDATLPLSAQEKVDVKSEVDSALTGYETNGVASQNDLGTTEANILSGIGSSETNVISEINQNEVKIDALQVDLTLLLSRLGIPPTTIYDALKAEIDANEALLITLTSDLATHDTAIKALIGTPITDLITDVNNRFDTVDTNIQANYDAIILIQNNVSTVLTGPKRLVRPDSGTKPYRYFVFNYDNTGNMEDFNADPTLTGTYISGGGPYFGGTMTHDGLGQYHYDIDVAFDDVLGAVQVKLDAVVVGTLAPRVMTITSEVTDYDDELQEIYDLAHANYVKLDAAVPAPTIPAQIDTHDTDIKAQLTSMESTLIGEINVNQVIMETVRDDVEAVLSHPNPLFIKSGYSQIDSEDPILIGATTIPIIDTTVETFGRDGGIALIDKGETNEELVAYSGFIDNEMQLVSPTVKDHDPSETVFERTRAYFHVTLRRKDGQPNIQADSVPSYSITHDDIGNEKIDTMVYEVAYGRYTGYIEYDIETTPGERSGSISIEIDSVTRDYSFDFDVTERPATERQINEAIGGAIPPNTFVFDHDGWIDSASIKHLWEDEMAGAIKDDAGQPIQIRIKAYLYDPVDVNVPILGPNPPYDNFTNTFGHYVGGLLPGKYLFTFINNGKKWKQVDRYIDYP